MLSQKLLFTAVHNHIFIFPQSPLQQTPMAEAILYTLASEVLKALGSEAAKALASAFNFRSDLRRLETTINSIKNVLLEAEERQVEDRTVTDWLRKLRAVLYEVEDLLEDFVASSAAWQGKSFATKVKLFFSSSNKLYQACRISHQIKEIRKNLDHIDSDRQRYSFRERPIDAPNSMKWRRKDDCHYLMRLKVIGRDGDKKIIMDMLFAPNVEQQKASVVCIEGMGGLGKTALAKLVFNDSEVKKQFDMMLWVCVAEEFGLETIIRSVLKSAAPDERCDDLEMDQLCCRLQEKLRQKRYLLVLDDVWNENREEWDKVRSPLGPCGNGSKILVTTRLQRVADIMVDGSARHKLKGLSAEESSLLFEELAFKDGQERNARLVELGKDIVKKCGGVPLAIRALASYLYAQDEGKWLSVKDKELPQVEGDTMKVLKLSYRHLRSELKQCFSYCCLFPKDTRMKKETLIRLWMAQGFILSSDDQSLEETGEEYFTELVQRCFFQDIERDEKGDIQYCMMHDLMHDLAQQVSEGEIVSAIKGRTTLEKGVSHVSFDFFFTMPSEIPTSLFLLMSLRTLIFHASTSDEETSDEETSDQERSGHVFTCPEMSLRTLIFHASPSDHVFSALLSSLKSLRVLELNGAYEIISMPRSIGKLVHLRYLCLINCSIETLPDSIGNLLNLQTLKLQGNDLKVLPRSIGKLVHLRYLCLSDCSIETLPDSIGNLLNLQTLKLARSKLRVLPCVIERLTSLRHLDLSGSQDLMRMAADISKLTNLRHLDLSFCDKLTHVAADISSLANLELLDLTGCWKIDQMPSGTGKLTKLRTLPWFMVGMRNASSLSPESHCGRFTDLKDLNGLRGELCIEVLGRLGAEQRQSDAANLRGKAGLLRLRVKFYCEDDEAIMKGLGLQPHPDLKELEIENYGGLKLRVIMEGLQPHPDLKKLVIENYGGLRLSSSMDQLSSALPNLVTIELEKFSRCRHLPSFAQLASLRKLSLSDCPGVEYMESSIGYKSAASPSQSSASVMPSFFPSLENLRLIDMPNMKGWWKGEERGEGQGSEIVDQPWQLDASNPRPLLPSFPKLSHLDIWSCPNLTCSPAPLSPYVEELKLFGEVDEKMVSMLKGQMATTVADHENTSFSSLSPSFSTLPVSNLKTLEISRLTTLESFPRDCFKGLLSLQSLEIGWLGQLRSLSSSGLEHLTGLRELTIWFCKELDLSDDEMMPWEALKSLRHLELWGIPKMSSVPAGFQHLTALESLRIDECGELGALPEWVTSLPSLQRIEMDKDYIEQHGHPLLQKGNMNMVAREVS